MDPQDHSAESARVPKFPTDLDDLRSTDKCPMCFRDTHRASTCPNCGLNLQDSRLAEVFTQSTIAADALVARGNLVAKAWRESKSVQQVSADVAADAAVPPVPAAPLVATAQPVESSPAAPESAWAAAQPQYSPHPVQPQPVQPQPVQSRPAQAHTAGAPAAAPAQAPTAPTKPRRSGIQLTLLILGVSFVSIAAIVFLTVAFVLFDLVVKSIITAGVTAAVIALASWLKHKRLTTTAEGIAILGVVLLILDLWAIRSLNLLGLQQIQGTLFWGVGLLLMTGILLGWGKLASLRAPRIASTFTIGPGIVAMLRWIFDWVFTDHSSTMIALAGLSIASILAPIVHRKDGKSDPLEVGIVFGIGQIGALALAFEALGGALAGGSVFGGGSGLTAAPHPLEEPLVAIVAAAISVAALLGHLRQLRMHPELAPIGWLRITGTILATMLWAAVVLVAALELFAFGPSSLGSNESWKALPFIALAAVFWDVMFLRAKRNEQPRNDQQRSDQPHIAQPHSDRHQSDRPRWIAGLTTTGAIVLFPAIWLLAGLVMLPVIRASASELTEYGTEWPIFNVGIAMVIASFIAFVAYRTTATDGERLAGRVSVSVLVAVAGATVTAMALPLWPSLGLLGVLMVGAIVTMGARCGNTPSRMRTMLLTSYIIASVGLALIAFLHRPFMIFAFAAIGIGFLVLRLIVGKSGTVLISLATVLLAVLTTVTGWAPLDFPYVSVTLTPALPIAMLLVAAGWRQLEVTDRRVFAWAGTLLLMLWAAQQIPLAFLRPGEPFAGTFWPAVVSMAIAALAFGTLVLLTFRAARADTADAWTHSVSLAAALPLSYVLMSPFVQVLANVTGAPISEVMLVWVLVTSAILAAAIMTLLRLQNVPDLWTRATDCLVVTAALIAMVNLIGVDLLSTGRITPWAIVALILAIAVPLMVTFRSVGQTTRGAFRGTFPWISAGFLALFGPVLVQRLVESPWPLLTTAPIALALFASAIVFGISGTAVRTEQGPWLQGGMLALGTALPLASLLGSRELVFDGLAWLVSLAVAILALVIAVICAFWRDNQQSASTSTTAPTRFLIITLLAPLAAMALITTASDGLEAFADAGTLVPDLTAYALALGIGVATWLGLAVVSRGVPVASPVAQQETSPVQVLSMLGIAATILIGFAALMLPPLPISVALAAWALGVALVLAPKRATANGPEQNSLFAFIQRVITAIALLVAVTSTLYAATLGQQFDLPASAIGVTVLGLGLAAILLMSMLKTQQQTPTVPASPATMQAQPAHRILSMAMVPVSAWGGLMAAPVSWPWWMPAVAAVIALTAALGVAIFRTRLHLPALAAAGVSALLPLATALAVTDATIRVWPFTWLVVGVSLVAYGFAIRHVMAGFLRGFGILLALISSAILLWPDYPEATVLFVAAPGCVLLLGMAIVGSISHERAISLSKFEAGAYALAAPLWFAGIAVSATPVVSGNLFAVLMIVLLCLSVASIAGFWFTEKKRPEFHVPLQMFAGGSGVAAITMFIAALLKGSDIPGDVYFLAFGLALTAVGALWLRSRPSLRSLPALGPGLVMMLLPLWFYEANEPTAARIGIYTVLVLAAVLVGALGKLQAPLVLGAIAAVAHLIVAVRWMLPELSVPWWIWLGAAGALLIFVAATYEARLKNAKAVVTSISQLR